MRPIGHGRKMRLIYAGAGAVALAVPAAALALTAGPSSSDAGTAKTALPTARRVADVTAKTAPRTTRRVADVKHVPTAADRGCGKLFTVGMGKGAANLIYSRTNTISKHQFKVLGYIERCQRNPAAQGFMRGYDARQARIHQRRVAAARAAAARRAAAAAAARTQAPQTQAAQTQASATTYQSSTSQAPQTSSSVTSSAASASSTGSASSGGGSPLPACTWQPESGGNPSAVNPSSGAGGYYQIMPSTWSAYGGTGSPQSAPMSEQTAIAQKIYANQGPGAWSNC